MGKRTFVDIIHLDKCLRYIYGVLLLLLLIVKVFSQEYLKIVLNRKGYFCSCSVLFVHVTFLVGNVHTYKFNILSTRIVVIIFYLDLYTSLQKNCINNIYAEQIREFVVDVLCGWRKSTSKNSVFIQSHKILRFIVKRFAPIGTKRRECIAGRHGIRY